LPAGLGGLAWASRKLVGNRLGGGLDRGVYSRDRELNAFRGKSEEQRFHARNRGTVCDVLRIVALEIFLKDAAANADKFGAGKAKIPPGLWMRWTWHAKIPAALLRFNRPQAVLRGGDSEEYVLGEPGTLADVFGPAKGADDSRENLHALQGAQGAGGAAGPRCGRSFRQSFRNGEKIKRLRSARLRGPGRRLAPAIQRADGGGQVALLPTRGDGSGQFETEIERFPQAVVRFCKDRCGGQ